MADDIIQEDVKQFILENIDAIAQLEALLLLRLNPAMKMSAKEIAQRLYIDEAGAKIYLEQLLAGGFLTVTEKELYQYRPKFPGLEQMVDRVADIYAKYLVPVTNLIHSKPKTKVQKFADAFRIRKD